MSKREALLGGILVPDLANPRPQDVDVAFLSYRMLTIVRFCGHPSALNLREHQDLCALIAEVEGGDDAVVEWARHHDCHEFATGDLTTPLKRTICATRLSEVQYQWDLAICGALGIRAPTVEVRDAVSRYDAIALCVEWQFLLGRDLAELGVDGKLGAASEDFRHLLEVVVSDDRRDQMRRGQLLLAG